MMRVDAVVIGAGAAGLFCAAMAGQRGRRVVLLDHSERLAEKIRISGGGRCNFTNRIVTPENFLSADPSFCKDALDRYQVSDFLQLIRRHGISYHEKHRGQLFCDDSSERIIDMLKTECQRGGVKRLQPVRVEAVRRVAEQFEVDTSEGSISSARVVVATGGLSIPKIGASDFGYRLARQFKLRVIEPLPALVPLVFDGAQWQSLSALAGLSAPASIRTEGAEIAFDEDLLFTHRGLSGPAVLQISSYWSHGSDLSINLLPGIDLARTLVVEKETSRQALANVLANWLPKRLSAEWLAHQLPDGDLLSRQKLAEIANKNLTRVSAALQSWRVRPSGTEGFKKAEVTKGGVATAELLPHSLESRQIKGLHFIGEVVDVTGWLGGYNFQWAWSSGFAAAQAI
jgi:predicted Rossmann fold flavoprotein